ncbi:MAG TPA: MdtA/MuxA family multidrug efflux RND transporter periplasmic adaptor subunit [Rhizomicrobium sp.]
MSDPNVHGHSALGTAGGKIRVGIVGAGRWADDHLPGGQRVLWIVGGLLLLLLVLWAIQPDPNAGSNRHRIGGAAMPVGVAKAVSGDIDVTLNALGTVTPIATVTVRPQVSGQLLKFDVEEGQMVKAGDVLAEIDPRTFQAAVDQAVGTLQKDQAALQEARIDVQRYANLVKLNAISTQTYTASIATAKQAEGTVKTDQASVDQANINLQYTKITSPVAGRVGLRQVDVGNIVESGQTNGVVVVTELQPISVLFSIPEDNVDAVMEQVNSGQTLRVDAYDRAQTKKLTSGTLSTVDNQIDPTTGTVKLRATFDNNEGALFPQQFVNVQLLVNTLHNQIIVPAAAIERGSSGAFVYVVNSDSTVSMRAVTLGAVQGDKQAISKGLKVGETVVTDGADRLKDGADVDVPSNKGKPIQTAAPPAGTSSSDDARAKRKAAMAAAMKQYCSADLAKYCAGMQPGSTEARRCFFTNRDSFSDDCKNALAKLRKGGGHHRGGGGGGGL